MLRVSEISPQRLADGERLPAEALFLLEERGEEDFPLILTPRSFLAVSPLFVFGSNNARNTIFLPGEVLYPPIVGYPLKGTRRTSSLLLTFMLTLAPLLTIYLTAFSILKNNEHFIFKDGYDTE
jgi:hypothetical protein